MSNNNISGWLILDKPTGITSRKAVNIVKRLVSPKKIGHAGTLDPLATGVLPIALGEATKTCQYAVGKIKEYEFSVRFGIETDSLDSDGEITNKSDKIPTEKELRKLLSCFIGKIVQIPPIFSAIKINGQRSYKLAREGKEVELSAREIEIHSLNLTRQDENDVFSFKVSCSKGTYVRSLARDIAYKLDTYGTIVALRRTQVGSFQEKDLISLEKLEELVHNGALFGGLMPIDIVLDDIPVIEINKGNSEKIRMGQKILVNDLEDCETICAKLENKVISIGAVQDSFFKPKRVFNY